MTEAVKQGDQVQIEYTGRLEDGTVFDTTDGRESFAFEAGSPNIISGMSDAVLGMQVGDSKTVEIEADDAYGAYDEELLLRLPREQVPEDVKVGDALSDGSPESRVWYVMELTDSESVLDGNHPLAGKKLIFDLTLIGINA